MLAHNRAWYLIARTLSNEASMAEMEELQSLLRADEPLQQQYAILRDLWKPSDLIELRSADKFESILKRAKQQELDSQNTPAIPRYSRKLRPIAWVAAASMLVLILSSLFILEKKQLTAQASAAVYTDSVVTQNGNRSQLILPDGSRVWLNAGSTLLYHNFSGNTREVKLIGEAYFDIVKIPSKPFIVHADGLNIKVLGTVFNVRCYPGDKKIEATLLHGSVAVTHNDDPEKRMIMLKPNQKLSISKQFVAPVNSNTVVANNYSINELDTTAGPAHLQETAWVYNRLEFNNMDFRTLAAKMERWYNVRIIFRDNAVQQLRFVGSFEKETVEQALKALQSVADFSFEKKKGEIQVWSLAD